MFSDGNTTLAPQVLSVVRTNVILTGVPARNVTLEGWVLGDATALPHHVRNAEVAFMST
jgi:hypothetical protein